MRLLVLGAAEAPAAEAPAAEAPAGEVPLRSLDELLAACEPPEAARADAILPEPFGLPALLSRDARCRGVRPRGGASGW